MRNLAWKRAAWTLGGAAAGFAWYYFVGCTTGTCPISSNPYVSTGYGAIVGALASGSFSREKKKEHGI
jgi:uncharacterized membrane protein YedE/YeeE